MLDEEADQLVGSGPYERTDRRAAYRAGRYERDFTATSDQATLRMPKLKGTRFATAVIERRKRRETSVEEAIIEMYQAGASTRRIEDISEILWGAGVSARHGRLDRRGVPEGQMPALHGAFLPQRACQGPQIQALPGRCHAQSHPRDGVAQDTGRQDGRRPHRRHRPVDPLRQREIGNLSKYPQNEMGKL